MRCTIRNFTPFWLLFFLLVYADTCFAQFYPVRRYAVEDGLAHSNVFRIFQDKKGFIWLGTDYGVSCFDGKKFSNYTSSEGLSFNTVMSISEGPGEEKWVCTYGGGINIITPDSVKPLAVKGDNISKSVIYSLFGQDKIWIIDKWGSLYSLERQEIKHLQVTEGQYPVHFRRMIGGADGEILFAANTGLYVARNGKVARFLGGLVNERVYALQQDKEGIIWCALKNRVVGIKGNAIITDIHTGNYTEVSDMQVDKNGAVWLAVPGEGILLISGGQVKNITENLKLRNILVNDLFEDRDGNIWIATHGSGLFFIHSLPIINYPVELEKINNYTKVISRINNAVCLGSVGTVSLCEKEKLISYPVNLLQSSDFIYFIHQWDKEIYIGIPRGLIIKNTDSKKEKLVPMHGALSYFRDNNNRQWIGSFNGLGYFESGDYKYVNHPAVLNRRINHISRAGNDILFATDSGLVRYNGKDFIHSNISSNTWSNSINHIFTGNGAIWLATDWGICHIKGSRQQWYYKKDGLSHNKCNAIKGDEAGNIWIGTMGGLDKFNGSRFLTFNHKSGLTSNEVLSLDIDEKGSLWAGTVNGVSRILKKEAESTIAVPAVYITGVSTPSGKYAFPGNVVLSPGEKELRINFTAPGFSYADKTEFSYLISGQGDVWHTTSDNSLTISSLAPGNYQFMIKAGFGGGLESKVAVLNITVLAPFWMKTWFIIACSLLAIGIFYFIVRWFIIRREKIKYEKVALHHKITYLKQQALTALINPHFIFNCLNSIQSYIYSNNTRLANQYLIKFSRLIRMTLDRAEHTYISLEEEIARLNLYLGLEQLRFGEKLQYSIHCDEGIVTNKIKIPNMILQPYIENAIRHGIRRRKAGGSIQIYFSCISEELLQIIIDDDGVGISNTTGQGDKTNSTHRPLGMKLTGERLHLLSQLSKKTFEVNISERTDEQGNIAGTRVTILVATNVVAGPVPAE